MTNYLTVRNNCQAVKIHCAISWATFQQDYRNDIAPHGGYVEYELHDIGWHDLTIIIGAASNRFLASNNNKSLALEFVWNFYKDLLFDLPNIGGKYAQIKAADGVRLKPGPLAISGIYTPDGNDVVVTGGDIQGQFDKEGSYVITRIDPLRAHWSNRLSPKNERDYVAA